MNQKLIGLVAVLALLVGCSESVTSSSGVANENVLSNAYEVGATVTITADALPTDIKYQWQRNGIDITSSSRSSNTMGNVVSYSFVATLSDNGATYRCKITSSTGGVRYSDETTISVKVLSEEMSLPYILTNPNSMMVQEGDEATFSVVAYDVAHYQWYINGTPIAGATRSRLNYTPTLAQNGNWIWCILVNDLGTKQTQNATIYVTEKPTAPSIITEPVSVTRFSAQLVTFTVGAIGTNIQYQWYKGDSKLVGENSYQYITNASSEISGIAYSCVVSNDLGKVRSAYASVEVDPSVIDATVFVGGALSPNIILANEGTGTGRSSNSAPYVNFAGKATYFAFHGAGSREMTSHELNLGASNNVKFSWIAGNSSNGGENVDSGEKLALSASPNGTIWTEIWIVPTFKYNWTEETVAIPAGTKYLRWKEVNHSGSYYDSYGLADVFIY